MTFNRRFECRLWGGGALALVLLAGVNPVLAQSSLPLDVDLTAEEAEPAPAEPAATEATITPAEEPLEVTPLAPPGPLRPAERHIEPTTAPGPAPASEDALPALSDPPQEMVPAEAPLEAPDLGDLTAFLIGQDADTAIAMLQQDGWIVIAQSPRMVQLDRGQLGLDIDIDGATGKVVGAELVDLT